MSDDEAEIKQMASSHKRYLHDMIAEQEAALARFQNSTYLSESTLRSGGGGGVGGGAATVRPVPSGGGMPNSSITLSASASPYVFNRAGGGAGSRSTFAAAPTPGYSRDGFRVPAGAGATGRVSPTPSNSSSGSIGVAPNTSIMANARRTLQQAAEWAGAHSIGFEMPTGPSNSAAAAAAGAGSTAQFAASTHAASSPLNLSLADTVGDAAASSNAGQKVASELQSRLWNNEHQQWERRMAELEDRLKRVQNASTMAQSQGASSGQGQGGLAAAGLGQSQQVYNVPVVGGRPVGTGVNALSSSLGSGGDARAHNVQTSELVLRLERELGAAVDALVQERKQTAQRESLASQRLESLEAELEAKERRIAALNTKWSGEFGAQTSEFQEQLERAYARVQSLTADLEAKERDVSSRGSESKRMENRIAAQEVKIRDTTAAAEQLRIDLERANRSIKELELVRNAADSDKRTLVADMESRSKQHVAKLERSKEEWMGRMDALRSELQTAHAKELREVRAQTAEQDRVFREAEHDNFVLATELQKSKEAIAAREAEGEKLRELVALEKSQAEHALRAQSDAAEASARLQQAKMQSALDEAQAALQDATSRLDAEQRTKRDALARIAELENDVRTKTTSLAEREKEVSSVQTKASSATAALLEAETIAASQASTIAQLRSSVSSLQEEISLLQTKLDSRASSKADEIRHLEAEHKKFRDKARQRNDELEQTVEEQRVKLGHMEKRNEALKADFESALQAATKEQAELIEKLERRVGKLTHKLAAKTERESTTGADAARMVTALRGELDRRAHSEEAALRQLADMEQRFKAERSRCVDVEAKLSHIVAVAPDGVAHRRVQEELAAAKQVAATHLARFREMQAKYERQSVRQNAMQNLLQRLQGEQQQRAFRNGSASMPLYRPLDNAGASAGTAGSYGGSSLADLGVSAAAVPSSTVAGGTFSVAEEEMFRDLLRNQQREARVRAHVRAFAAGTDYSTDDEYANTTRGEMPAAGRATYSSRLRSRSAPRLLHSRHAVDSDGEEQLPTSSFSPSTSRRRRSLGHSVPVGSSSRSSRRRAKDDTDVNLNLKVNFDPRVLQRFRELDLCGGGCAQSDSANAGGKPHDSRACKICQRRAFGRGLDISSHYAPEQHLPPRRSPSKDRMPHV